jgi:hypothetical protein
MLLYECKEAGIEWMANCLKEYVESRDHVLKGIGQDYGLQTYKEQKQAVNVALNGGSPLQPKTLREPTSCIGCIEKPS